jgi:hypothetical protein
MEWRSVPSARTMAQFLWIYAVIIAAIAFLLTSGTRKKYRYPPSPPGYNILKGGHVHLLTRGPVSYSAI